MKTAVIYYSLDGNTAAAAKEIADTLQADIFELKEKSGQRKGAFGFMKSGMQAAMNYSSKLNDDFKKEMGAYERVYIGTPVWAGHSTPAVNAFACSTDFSGKDVYVFFLCASPEADYRPKGIDYLSRVIGKRNGTLKGIYVWHGGAPGKPAGREKISEQVRRAL